MSHLSLSASLVTLGKKYISDEAEDSQVKERHGTGMCEVCGGRGRRRYNLIIIISFIAAVGRGIADYLLVRLRCPPPKIKEEEKKKKKGGRGRWRWRCR